MFSPSVMNATLYEEVSSVLNAVHRAAFDDAATRGERPDPLLSVPVRLIPLVQSTRSMRRELAACTERCALLAAVLDLTSMAIVVIDDQREVLFANAQARRSNAAAEASAFQLRDARADQDLGRALDALRSGTRCERRPDGVLAMRLVRLPGERTAIALVLARPAPAPSLDPAGD